MLVFLLWGVKKKAVIFSPNGPISGLVKEDKALEFILTVKMIILLNLD